MPSNLKSSSVSAPKKVAVILFNLGGPDKPESVKPFLFNLFNDKAIISVPQPMRWVIAKLISSKRAPIAAEIYHELGGGSPLLENTEAQALAIEQKLNSESDDDVEFKCFIAMRYWKPFSYQTIKDVEKWGATEQILLPLYPQFSTTTSGSSIQDWLKYSKKLPYKSVCCYPQQSGFIHAQSNLIRETLNQLKQDGITDNIRILFTAHGLPKKVIEAGDPYQYQVEQTSLALAKNLKEDLKDFTNIDWVTCYQSRVGPLEWIKPYTEDEIIQAGKTAKNLIVVPIAFVSEHSETLVELDIEYKELAEENGMKSYHRVQTVGVNEQMIKGWSDLVLEIQNNISGQLIFNGTPKKICPGTCGKCIYK